MKIDQTWTTFTEYGGYIGTTYGPMEREAHDLGSYNFEVVAGLDGDKKSISFIPAVQKANGAYVTLMSDNWLSLGVGNSDGFNKKASFIPVKNLDASGKYDGTF